MYLNFKTASADAVFYFLTLRFILYQYEITVNNLLAANTDKGKPIHPNMSSEQVYDL